MDDRAARLARNEATFRAFNDGIRRIEEALNDGRIPDFVCECSTATCVEPIRLTLAEYDAVRADERQFVVRKGHEQVDVEDVVRELRDYRVVVKR
jgi:hypothetical protein